MMTENTTVGVSHRGRPMNWLWQCAARSVCYGLPIIVALFAAGCDVSIDAINGYEPITQSQTGGGSGEETGGEENTDQVRVRVVNNYTFSLHAVYVSPCSASTWGSNRLSGTIGSGSSSTFGPFTPGCYDLRADATDGKLFTLMGADLQGGTFLIEAN